MYLLHSLLYKSQKSSESIPIVPEIAQQIPGVGECLPSGTPLVNSQSPSLVQVCRTDASIDTSSCAQNFLREVPLAQGVLRSFSPTPDVDYNRLMGKWHWVLTSDSDTEHHCATSECERACVHHNHPSV
jgi:hypothetical protein